MPAYRGAADAGQHLLRRHNVGSVSLERLLEVVVDSGVTTQSYGLGAEASRVYCVCTYDAAQ
jgi:hypothetical protein